MTSRDTGDGITGPSFHVRAARIQVLEAPPEAVRSIAARIERDERPARRSTG